MPPLGVTNLVYQGGSCQALLRLHRLPTQLHHLLVLYAAEGAQVTQGVGEMRRFALRSGEVRFRCQHQIRE